MLTFYLNENLDPEKALVLSVSNPIPISAPELVFGDSLSTRIFIVDGSGNYSSASGAIGSTVKVGIGLLGTEDPAWLNENWMAITNGWSGVISPNIQAVFDLFNGKNFITAVLQIKVTDAQGNVETYASIPFKLLKTILPNGALPTPPEHSTDGTKAIPSGSDTVTVSGLGLSSVPRRIIPILVKPAGGLNIFPTLIKQSITADGFSCDLSGQTDSDQYSLDYVLIF